VKGLLLATILVLACPALADSQLVLNRPLSDADFYKAVACAAPPGKGCVLDIVRWPDSAARDLVIKVAATQPRFARDHGNAGVKALQAAIDEINSTGAGLTLRRAKPDETGQIEVWFSDLGEGDAIELSGQGLPRGDRMEGARVYIWWNDAKEIDRAVIILSHDLLAEEMTSVMLEELTQSLGFLTDLEGSAYAESSIFSETSNAITQLRGQDRMVLRRHYPPN
jgi:hypothetical protein